MDIVLEEHSESGLFGTRDAKRITMKDYLAFCTMHRNFDPSYSKMRLGQLFCNKFGLGDTELYYMEDREKTQEIILSYVVN
jgi:hypothetical protein